MWDTVGVPSDTYSICAIAHCISGEMDIADNLLVNDSVTITLPGVHDVAVTAVTPSKTIVCQDNPMSISVEVTNLGAFPETFHVTVEAVPSSGSPTIIGTQLVSLAPAETRVLTFDWLTSGVPIGTYTIRATAETVLWEANSSNNILSDGQVKVSIPGDVNGDDIVDISDAALIGGYWQSTVPPAPPEVDINGDGIIDISDAAIVGGNWQRTYP
jgi:hypothetical protein